MNRWNFLIYFFVSAVLKGASHPTRTKSGCTAVTSLLQKSGSGENGAKEGLKGSHMEGKKPAPDLFRVLFPENVTGPHVGAFRHWPESDEASPGVIPAE